MNLLKYVIDFTPFLEPRDPIDSEEWKDIFETWFLEISSDIHVGPGNLFRLYSKWSQCVWMRVYLCVGM